MFRLLSAIFALFIALVHAKHEDLRIYSFASADCNGPAIYGNLDFKRDKCTPVMFGASSIKLMEVHKGDWTKDINAGPTGCYFYAYTQYGCLERYLDTIVDPGDVISTCIPSRDANAPILSVSYMCIRGAPPKRSLPPGAGNLTHGINDTVQYASKRGLKWHAPVFVNQTARLNETGKTGGNSTTRHDGPTIVYPRPGFNLTSRFNSTLEFRHGNLTTRHHGPAFVNGQPNFNSTPKANEGNLTVRHYGPAIVDGKLNFRPTPGSNKETSWNETQPAINQTAEQDVPAVVEPAANKTVVHNSTEVDDSGDDSDNDSDDSDWDEDSDSETPNGNSTSLDKRMHWWQGPRRGVWMLHPWTGGILCYECYSKSKKMLSQFECRYSPDNPTDCGERPLAPVYTKTVSIQPVVTVSSGDAGPLGKRSWHRPVYLHNPWYPGMTLCAKAEWEGRGKRLKQEIRIELPARKLRKCEKSPQAQNIAIYIRTATTTAPVRTVSLVDTRDNELLPLAVPATVSSSSSSSSSGSALATAVVTTKVPVVVLSSVTVVQSKSLSKTLSKPSLSILTYAIPTSTVMATKTVVVTAEPEVKPAPETVMAPLGGFKTVVVVPNPDDTQ